MTSSSIRSTDALRDAAPRPYWTDRPGALDPFPSLTSATSCDLLVVGAGLTGLWAAIEATISDPSCDVVLVDAERIGFGASGRNGGFVSESLTHGLAHGAALWPDELPTLLRLGRENVAEIASFVASERIDADLRLVGKTVVATAPHHLRALDTAAALNVRFGEDVTLLDATAVQNDVHSPTYLGGLRQRSGGGLVDPAALCWGLARSAIARGVRIFEGSQVRSMRARDGSVEVATDGAALRASRVVLATNAYPPLLRRLRTRILPIFDHVLVTEPLTASALDSIGWAEAQGLTDVGNQFHYYRRTPDDRILWGGYDAIYYFRGRSDASLEQRDASHALLAQQFFGTFPQLEGIGFTHRWAGLIDSTSRFTPAFGTALRGRVGDRVGFTGLGVAASRFGARTVLDLIHGRDTERTRLTMVRRSPTPFPPEPLRYPLVQATRAALAREDRTGRRGTYLRTLDRFGVGFNS